MPEDVCGTKGTVENRRAEGYKARVTVGGDYGGVIAKDEALLRRKRPRGRLKNVVGVLKVRDS
jgi:hypothetical protein